MKRATWRAFSWILVISLVAPMALPAAASSSYVKSGGGKKPVTSAAPLAGAAQDAAHTPEAGIGQTAAASQPITTTGILTGVVLPAVDLPLSATGVVTWNMSAPDAAVSLPSPLLTMSADPFQIVPGGVITYTVINPNGSQRQTRYRFDATMANREIGVVDELGHQQIQEIDAFGRLVKAKQYTVTVTGSPPVPNWSATVYAAASYEYDVADRLKRMVGPDNAETIISYDALGRKTSMNDPDMGVWLYRWDAGGNLRKQRDAKNVMTCFHYDSLNRPVGKSFHPNTPDPASVNCSTQPTPYPVAYSYDAGPNGKGRRSSATVYNSAGSVSNSVSWTYDSRGRVTKETVSVTPSGFTSALSYETDYSYDAADRLRTMTYPADVGGREIVTTAYDAQGLPYSLTSSNGATYVSSTTYDTLGRLDQQMLGNALKVDRNYWDWSEADGGGRLKRIFLLKAPYNSGNQSDKLQDLMYRYDVAGNVTNIQDTINRSGNEFQRECFSYDALNRLTRGFSTGAATCNNNPGAVGSGVYDQSYAFTANGNLASKTGVGSYTYSASSPSGCATSTQATKPHAVKTAGGATYTYDCNGNMTGRAATGSTVTLAYDAENRLASVTDPVQPPGRQTTFYQYNVDGQRVVKADTYNGTLFVGNHMEANWTTGPLAWPLGDFEAIDQGDDILVSWVTLFETELLGFNLHRSTDPDQPEQQLNPAVIPVQNPGSTTGAFYTWLDEEVEQGKPYYYWLELLTPSGSEWAGPIGVGEGRLPTSQSPQVTGPNSYRRYYYLGGQRIATRFVYATGSILNYLHADHLGSTRLTTNESGQVLQDEPSAYYPYGELRYGQPYSTRRFTGQYFDDEIDLYYYGARYYDAALARFTQPDTIVPEPGNPQALNRYSYVLNNPLRYTDPTGMFEQPAIEEYLQSLDPDTWQDILKLWIADDQWWTALLAAQAGDILTVLDPEGNMRFARFEGEGKTKLSGLTLVDDAFGNGNSGYSRLDKAYRGSLGLPAAIVTLSQQRQLEKAYPLNGFRVDISTTTSGEANFYAFMFTVGLGAAYGLIPVATSLQYLAKLTGTAAASVYVVPSVRCWLGMCAGDQWLTVALTAFNPGTENVLPHYYYKYYSQVRYHNHAPGFRQTIAN